MTSKADVARSLAVLDRVVPKLLSLGDDAEWPVQAAEDVAALLDVVAEAARAARELLALDSGYVSSSKASAEASALLPLNRKERFYTATVLPMIIAGDGFANLDRFLELCGVETVTVSNRSGDAPCQLLTEYGFAESLVGADDPRWLPNADRRRDTPDLVLAAEDWLVAIEAKMFDRPSSAALHTQLLAQQKHIEEWRRVLHIDPERVKHVALLPDGLAKDIGALDGQGAPWEVRVVSWEQVAARYRVVGPAYWVSVLEAALERWPQLVAQPTVYGQNAESRMRGREIADRARADDLPFAYMGRVRGLEGPALRKDLATGGWRNQVYEVRRGPLPANRNWFSVAAFIARLNEFDPSPSGSEA